MSKLNILILIVFFSIVSCKEKNQNWEDDITISVSIAPYADFTKRIVGNRAVVNTLIPPGSNAHSYEPKPKELKNILDADIYFRVGKEFKLENILLDKLKSNINKIVDCSENINIIDRDPHFWLSTENAKTITQTITDSLSLYYPQHKNYFNNNKSQFFNEIDSAVSIIKNVLEKKQEKTLFVYHPAWRYFVEEFGLIQIAIEREGKHPKAGDLKVFIESAKDKGANCIFFDPHFDVTAVSTVANSLNIKIDSINPLPENYMENLFDIADKLNEHLK